MFDLSCDTLSSIVTMLVICVLGGAMLYTKYKNRAVQDSFTNAAADFDVVAELRALASEVSHGVEDDAFVVRCVYRAQRLALVSRSEEDVVVLRAPELGALCGGWTVAWGSGGAAPSGAADGSQRATGDAGFDAAFTARSAEEARAGWLGAELRGALMALVELGCVRSAVLSSRGLEVGVDRAHLLYRPQLAALLEESARVCAAVRESSARQALDGEAAGVGVGVGVGGAVEAGGRG